MFTNYFKIAFRNLSKYKTYFLINIFGLAIGMTCAIVILLWIQNELSYDRFHQNADHLYRVLQVWPETNSYSPAGPGPLAMTMKAEYPEIKNSARLFSAKHVLKFEDKVFQVTACGVESSFVELFSFPFVEGDNQKSFSDPNFIILTEETANKYFGNEDPIGKTVYFEWWSRWLEFHVTGVVKNVPSNSHLQFDILIPFSFVTASEMQIDQWDVNAYHTYVQLDKNADVKAVNQKIAGIVKQHYPDSGAKVELEPISKIHLYNHSGGGPIIYLYIFGSIGIFVLIIACMNFMNLSTAHSLNRAKEVGLRKVVGSNRVQLIIQFLSESVFMAFLALLVAIGLVQILLPSINHLLGNHLTLHFTGQLVFNLVGITFVTGLVSGSYPALFLSSFRPGMVLKGNVRTDPPSPLFRKALVITQFVISTLLIIGILVVHHQLDFIKNRKLGIEKEHIVNFEMGGSFYDKYQTIKQELLKNPDILSIAQTNFSFGGGYSVSHVDWEGKPNTENITMQIYSVDFDFQKIFNVEMVEGRFFSEDFQTDVWQSFILNETAVKYMGLEAPVGKQLSCDLPFVEGKGKIIGVVKDFHFQSLHSEITPLILVVHPWWYTDAYIKISSNNVPNSLAVIQNKLKELVPEFPFNIRFVDEEVNQLYETEQRAGVFVQYGTLLALIIACLGLLGLTAYTTQRRTKEIGIRKAFGATIPGIVHLLTEEYIKWILIANLFAWPIAWFAMNKWLQNFAYRIDLTLWPFLLSSWIILLIALLTVGWQTIRAARANPIEALRYE